MKKQILFKATFYLLGIGLVFWACEKKPEAVKEVPMPVDIITLETAVWQLSDIMVDPTPMHVPDSLPISIKFAEGNLEGHGGCNGIGGKYTVDGDKLTIRDLIRTKMYCEGASQWEEMFLQRLEKSQSYKINGERLEIQCGDLGWLVFRLNWAKR